MTAGRSGKLLKTVSVFSNDPKKPIAQLNIAIDIDAPDGGFVTPQSAPGLRRAPPALPAQRQK